MPVSAMPDRASAAPSEDLSGVVPAQSDQPDQPPPGASQAASGDNRTQAVRMIRQLTTQIDALAQQFPEASEAARAASQALVKAAVSITGNSQDQGKSAAPPNR